MTTTAARILEASAARIELLVVAVKQADASMVFNPEADYTLQVGETLIVISPEHYDTLARGGWTKDDVRRRIQEVIEKARAKYRAAAR